MRLVGFILFIFMILQSVVFVSCGTFQKERGRPPEKEIQYVKPNSRDIPFAFGETYQYRFQRIDRIIGTGEFKIDELTNGNFSIHSTIDIDDEDSGEILRGVSTLILDEGWNPISYDRTIESEFKKENEQVDVYRVEISFDGSLVKIRQPEPGEDISSEEVEIENPGGIFISDSNFIGMMAYMCSQPVLKSGRRETLKVLSVVQMKFYDVMMTPKIKHEMEFAGRKVTAYEVDMKVENITFGHYYITEDGVMIQVFEEGGMLIIDLIPPDDNS